MKKSIGELQHEYLTNLLQMNKSMTIKQSLYRVYTLNQYYATMYLNLKV